MNFFLARSFTRALERLDKQSASLAKRAALDFQLDPSQPGFRFHRIQNARDRNMWSFRVNQDVRAIVHHVGDAFTLCYVDHHDDAYAWAERHYIEDHPTTGQTQIVEVVERTEVVTQTVYDQQTVVLPPLADATPSLLLSIGVPTEWVDWVRAASEDTLLEHIEVFPESVQHDLLALLTGGLVSPPPPRTDGEPAPSREIVEIRDPDDLARALDAPWEQWLVFLHPDQRAVVDRSYSGAARVFGSAGTGKTIVALHRVKWLLERDPDAPVLFTTFTHALTANLRARLGLLIGEDFGDEHPGLVATNFDRWLTRWHRDRFGKMELATEQDVARLIDDALGRHPGVGFGAEFILSEFKAIIDPYDVRTRAAYFDTPRTGRGTPLGKRQKAAIWGVFEDVQARLQATGRRTRNGYSGVCARYFAEHPGERPFRHVVVDEAQDFSPIQLRALRALAPEGADDLFLCSDAGQRLYGRGFSWLRNGVDIRGRSTRLDVNYRTTEQIRAACESLLPETLEGPVGEHEVRQARSLRRGEDITLASCGTSREQQEALERWIDAQLERGVAPEQIAVLGREQHHALNAIRLASQRLGFEAEGIGEQSGRAGAVVYGGMKAAKGLEFQSVAIVDCDARTVPLARALEDAAGDQGDVFDVLEMERNLLYVAGTRARDQLFISYVGEPSRFLSLLVDPPAPAPRAPLPVTEPTPELTRPAPRGSSQFSISPSRVAQYFGYDCARYMRYSSAFSDARRAADRVPEAAAPRAFTQAIFDGGYAWEREVLTRRLDPGVVLVAPGDGDLTERYFDREQTLEVLRAARPGEFIYEMTLAAPAGFYERFGMDPSLVTVSKCRPDLVEVLAAPEGAGFARLLRVIDMKRSTAVHATHHVQLMMYALLLEEVLRDAGIDDARVDVERAAIWLGDHDEPTPCDLRGVRAHVTEFLREGSYDLFTRPADQVDWHVQTRCESCPYLESCVEEMNATDDLSRLPRMTHQGKNHLRASGVTTVAQVEALFADEERTREVIDPSATLSGQRHLIAARARALNRDEVVQQGFMARGLTLPTRTEIQIVLTIQRESLGRHVYALGYQMTCAQDVPDRVVRRGEGDRGAVLVARDAQESVNIRRQLVVELYGLLSRVDAYNLGQEWRDKLSVQFFVYSRTEESLLTGLLFEAMEERETARAARTLLMYFQGPDLILSREHPEHNVALPVAVLLDIVGRVAALPIPVAYTLPETLAALEVPVDYPRDPLYHHPFATYLRADAIFEAWHQGRPERVPEIIAHLTLELTALTGLYARLRELAAADIHTYMPKFELPSAARIRDPLLSRLAFFAQYEAALKCTQVRGQRMIARRAIPTTERVHELTATSEDRFELCVPAPRLEPSGFKTWLLARDTPEGRRAQIQYNDFYHRNAFAGGGRRSPHLAITKIDEVELDGAGEARAVRCKPTRKFDGPAPRAGEAFLLYERFSNSLMDRNIAVLEALERRPDDLLRQTLGHPDALAPAPIDVPVDASSWGLTPSQRAALDHITTERVLALWGPPGTGKTHFLATTILGLMEAHRRAKRPLRVLIHAFTHAASENVLSKLVSLQRASGIFEGAPVFAKAKEWKGEQRPEGVKEIRDTRRVPKWLEEHEHVVIAGTAWAFDKLVSGAVDFDGVDLVVMDEASQIKVPEGAIGMNLTHATGRVILAGDHLQLPPIVQGTYPEPEEGEVTLHRSIFEAVCQVQGGRFMRQLEENFRMNDTLTAASAALLYGDRYRCGTEALARARLAYTPLPSHSEFAKTVLSAETSLAVVLLHDLAPGKDNALEASVTAELALALREGLADDGAPFQTDAEFFARGLFVVSPHHSQIRRIRDALGDLRRWDAEPFVDTVDKMQGQESMAVLVSYGVSDPEFAMSEAEFIYSRNRLNVSITRGRHKTVLLLPASLLHAPPRILEREEAAVGLGYMRELVEWVRSRGEETLFLRDGHQVEVLTV